MGSDAMKTKSIEMPKFANEAEEADWWASAQGREFVKQKSTGMLKKGSAPRGSRLIAQLGRAASVQIALRLPEPDVTRAREIAARKGIGYQTLLKMLVHEGLRREGRRP
jgi:predicted DNA binding CopG/RHH family protein